MFDRDMNPTTCISESDVTTGKPLKVVACSSACSEATVLFSNGMAQMSLLLSMTSSAVSLYTLS